MMGLYDEMSAAGGTHPSAYTKDGIQWLDRATIAEHAGRRRRVHGAGDRDGDVGYSRRSRCVAAVNIGGHLLVGVILYEVQARQRPIKRATAADTMSAILKEEPPELSESGRTSPALNNIVRHCLEKDRENRSFVL